MGYVMWLHKTRENLEKVYKWLFLLKLDFGWKTWEANATKIM